MSSNSLQLRPQHSSPEDLHDAPLVTSRKLKLTEASMIRIRFLLGFYLSFNTSGKWRCLSPIYLDRVLPWLLYQAAEGYDNCGIKFRLCTAIQVNRSRMSAASLSQGYATIYKCHATVTGLPCLHTDKQE